MARPRFRRCVECPRCHVRYLIAFSPYRNGSYLVPAVDGSSDVYTLYCSCRRPPALSRWRGSEMKICDVSKIAHDRGYGTAKELVLARHEYARRGYRTALDTRLEIDGHG
jgi:hypothetical protein